MSAQTLSDKKQEAQCQQVIGDESINHRLNKLKSELDILSVITGHIIRTLFVAGWSTWAKT